MPRTDDLGDDLPLHNTPDVDWRGIGLGIVHASAHVGIQRKKLRRHENLSLKRLGHWTGFQTKITRPRQALRPRRQNHLSVGIHRKLPEHAPWTTGRFKHSTAMSQAPSVPRRSEMPRFKTCRSDVA